MKKVEIYPATINKTGANPVFSNIPAPVLKLISLKDKAQPPVFLFSLSNAYVSPYGPVFKNGIVFKESVYKSSTKKRWNIFLSCYKKILKNKVKKIEGDCVVICHSWYHSYGHWLTEIIPRLFLVKEELSNKRLIVHKDLSKFHFEILSKFNCKDIVYVAGNNKIYISRSKARHMKIINESELEEILKPRGFVKVFLEDISFDEQVQLLNSASIVISSHGSGLANVLFMQPGTHIINLASNDHHDYFCLPLAGAANMNYSHINCNGTVKLNPAYNDITVDVNIVREILESIPN
ncbi:MAG: glycosyltransferase family 61 protein [Bacteroidetes bacterium]|nr:glycosyltransferase family 61 protein [Bacteroidota bacterium]